MSHSDPLLGAVTVANSPWRPSDLLRLPRSPYEAFAALTGWGLLLHLLAAEGERSAWLLLAVAGAVGLMLRPESVLAMTAVFAAMVGRTLFDVDPPPGFWLFLAVLAPFWFGTLVAAMARHRGWPLMAEVGPRFAPVFRSAFVAGWLVVLAHQINDAFFDLAASCTVELYGRSRDVLFFLPDLSPGRADWLPMAVIVVELIIVIGLWLAPLRRLPVAVAVVFHLGVGVGEPALGALAFGFLVLFMYYDVVEAALDQLQAIGHRRPIVAALGALFCLVVIVVAAVKVVTAVVFGAAPFDSSSLPLASFLATMGLLLTGLLLLVAYVSGTFGPVPLNDVDEPAEWIGPTALLMFTVVIAVGIAPYLGLGTALAFADYSNLRTEDGRWNHRLAPEAARVFDTQQPLVRVIGQSPGFDESDLAGWGDDLPVPLSRVLVVEGELTRRLARACGSGGAGDVGPLTLDRLTSLAVVDDPCSDPDLDSERGRVVQQVLAYRAVPQGDLCLP